MKPESGYAQKMSKLRTRLLQDFNGVCFYCGKKLTTKTVTIDHFIPLSKGGAHIYENFRPACKECNQKKADQILDKEEVDSLPGNQRIVMLKDRIKLITQIQKVEKALQVAHERVRMLTAANIELSEALHRERIQKRKAFKFLIHYRTLIQIIVKRFNKKSLEELLLTKGVAK